MHFVTLLKQRRAAKYKKQHRKNGITNHNIDGAENFMSSTSASICHKMYRQYKVHVIAVLSAISKIMTVNCDYHVFTITQLLIMKFKPVL